MANGARFEAHALWPKAYGSRLTAHDQAKGVVPSQPGPVPALVFLDHELRVLSHEPAMNHEP